MTRRKFIGQLKRIFEDSQEAVIRYLTEEIKFLMAHLARRPKPTEGEKAALARAAKAVDPIYLEKAFNLFTPATLYRWYQELIRKKWDYSHLQKNPGRPRVDRVFEELVVKLALENPKDGFETLVGRLKTLGFETNAETIQNVLKRNGIPPAPDRKERLTWKEFLEIHWESLTATDFFTWEVLTPFGLVTYYVLFFIRLKDRKVHIAGVTTNPNENWMRQMARNLTDPETGFLVSQASKSKNIPSGETIPGELKGIKSDLILLHDRDGKYTAHFDRILNETSIETMELPPESPNLNAYAERFVRTIKEQCLSRLIITSEESLRKAIKDYIEFYHHERSHQGIGNIIPFPRPEDNVGGSEGKIIKRSRLGNLLNSYFRVQNGKNTMQPIGEIAV